MPGLLGARRRQRPRRRAHTDRGSGRSLPRQRPEGVVVVRPHRRLLHPGRARALPEAAKYKNLTYMIVGMIFENVAGYDMPVVTNVAANRKLLAACLGVAPADLPTAFRERCQKYIPCEVAQAPGTRSSSKATTSISPSCRSRCNSRSTLRLTSPPGRFRPRSGDRRRHHRLPPVDAQGQEPPRRFAAFAPPHVRIPSARRGAGKSLPAAITIGTHPLHYMGSMVYAYPPNVRKFEIIGGLFGEPYRLARCGVDDLEVPAGAEIIIEGEILAGVHEPEGPFGEFTGYASYRSTQNVFVAQRIRMRARHDVSTP